MNFGRTRNRQWGRIAVMALCFLVLGFSFGAKLSLYQPKSKQIQTFASSKMWQHEVQDAAAVMAAPDDLNPVAGFAVDHFILPLLAAVMAIMMVLSGGEWLERESPPALRAVAFFSRRQLRAPPVR